MGDIHICLNGEFGGYRSACIHTSKVLGTGTLGSVVEATLDQLHCAAKIMHDILCNDYLLNSLTKELKIWKSLKHPCIVQLLCEAPNPKHRGIILLIELMKETLTEFLEVSSGPLPLQIQLNITCDIAQALAYLHQHNILHRDLCSSNVLLTEGIRAKVYDFSNSKVIDYNMSGSTMTLCPGSPVYMPPEALLKEPFYCDRLDIFSFGVLIIQIITRASPTPTAAKAVIEDPSCPSGEISVSVPEWKRRKKDIDKVPSEHPLLPIAQHCLKDRQQDRPTAAEICPNLESLKVSEKVNYNATDSGRFEFVRSLGEGCFGTVFLAHDKQNNDRKVSIKCIKAGKASESMMTYITSTFAVETNQEADMLLKLRHPHILGFFKAYKYVNKQGENAIAIVTDFCENGDLHTYLSQGSSLERFKRLQWFQQLAEGLHYIHSQGIVHRDIKPQNILISGERTLKIADVGLAKHLYDSQSKLGITDQPFHKYFESAVGTMHYMAPELWTHHYNEKSDVFSLGLVFVAMAEFSPLPVAKWFEEELPLGKLYNEIQATHQQTPSHLLKLSKGTLSERRLSDRMLEYDYHIRFSSQEVLLCLQDMIASNSEAPPPKQHGCCVN